MEELRKFSTSQRFKQGFRSHETISKRRDLTYFLELLCLRYVHRPRLNWFLEAYESGLRAAASTAGQAIS